MATEDRKDMRTVASMIDDAFVSVETALTATRVLQRLVIADHLHPEDADEGDAFFVFMDGIIANMQKGLDVLDEANHATMADCKS